MEAAKRGVRAALQRAVYPFVEVTKVPYQQLNAGASSWLRENGKALPTFVTADNITTARTALLVPTLALLSHGCTAPAAVCVTINTIFDWVDGVVARWERSDPDRSTALRRTMSPPWGTLLSARAERLRADWGAYYDAVADKAFAIPVWLCLFHGASADPLLQAALLSLSASEGFSAFVRTRAYFCEPSASALAQHSAVTADAVGKAKHFFSMVGTVLVLLPPTQLAGTALLCAALPLSIASVQRKLRASTVYVELSAPTTGGGLGSHELQLLEDAKLLGSTLIVGCRAAGSDGAGRNVLEALHLASGRRPRRAFAQRRDDAPAFTIPRLPAGGIRRPRRRASASAVHRERRHRPRVLGRVRHRRGRRPRRRRRGGAPTPLSPRPLAARSRQRVASRSHM